MTTATHYRLNRTSGPAQEPISVADAKKQLELSSADSTHDEALTEAIEAAREQFEKDTPWVPVSQTFELLLDAFPSGGAIELPVRPVTAISSITYADGSDAEATLSSSLYSLSRTGRFVLLAYDQEWPSIVSHPESVVITFVAGFPGQTAVPRLIKRALLLQVGKWFVDRDMMETQPEMQFDQAYERIIRRLMRASYP